jgi:hypothetical protein
MIAAVATIFAAWQVFIAAASALRFPFPYAAFPGREMRQGTESGAEGRVAAHIADQFFRSRQPAIIQQSRRFCMNDTAGTAADAIADHLGSELRKRTGFRFACKGARQFTPDTAHGGGSRAGNGSRLDPVKQKIAKRFARLFFRRCEKTALDSTGNRQRSHASCFQSGNGAGGTIGEHEVNHRSDNHTRFASPGVIYLFLIRQLEFGQVQSERMIGQLLNGIDRIKNGAGDNALAEKQRLMPDPLFGLRYLISDLLCPLIEILGLFTKLVGCRFSCMLDAGDCSFNSIYCTTDGIGNTIPKTHKKPPGKETISARASASDISPRWRESAAGRLIRSDAGTARSRLCRTKTANSGQKATFTLVI